MTENTQPRRANVALIVTTVVGGVLLLAAIGFAAVAGIFSLTRGDSPAQTISASADGITELRIDASAADFTLAYDSDDAGEAVLEASSGRQEWELRREGSRLVAEPRGGFPWGWLRLGPDLGQTVVLHLPAELRDAELDAELELSSGSLRAKGGFGELDVEVSSGLLSVEGEAREVDIDVSSGQVEFALADVARASIGVSSGGVVGEFTGRAPDDLGIDVSSGRVEVLLPDGSYAVQEEVSSGSVDNRLRTDPDSRNAVEVSVSSGQVVLRPAD